MMRIHARRSSYLGFTVTSRDWVPLQLLVWDDQIWPCVGYADGPYCGVSFEGARL